MPSVFRLTAAALVCALLLPLLRQRAGEFALLLTLAACVGLTVSALRGLSTLLDLLEELAGLADVDPLLLGPLLRATGISLVTGLAAQLCRDAQAGSLALTVELCGGVCALYAALPLLHAVMTLIQELI
jgi:stage III sporulation protein AD